MEQEQQIVHEDIMAKNSKNLKNVFGGDIDANKLMMFLQKPRQVCNRIVVDGKTYQPKIVKLVKHVQAAIANGKKCLIFSQYLSNGVNPIQRSLERSGVKSMIITGECSMKDRADAVKSYNRVTSCKVLLLSKAGGEGLDLKETDEIHVLEPHYNNSMLEQVFGRGIRYKSHQNKNAVVERYIYYAKKRDEKTKESITAKSADMMLYELSKKKEMLVKKFIKDVIKPISV
jgi:SNF2 family DNA or RNA helicase